MREYAILYNRIVETCFEKCVFTFNYRYLVDDEVDYEETINRLIYSCNILFVDSVCEQLYSKIIWLK